jgi:hypothetical protein
VSSEQAMRSIGLVWKQLRAMPLPSPTRQTTVAAFMAQTQWEIHQVFERMLRAEIKRMVEEETRWKR